VVADALDRAALVRIDTAARRASEAMDAEGIVIATD
jgi:hypothetical protein